MYGVLSGYYCVGITSHCSCDTTAQCFFSLAQSWSPHLCVVPPAAAQEVTRVGAMGCLVTEAAVGAEDPFLGVLDAVVRGLVDVYQLVLLRQEATLATPTPLPPPAGRVTPPRPSHLLVCELLVDYFIFKALL